MESSIQRLAFMKIRTLLIFLIQAISCNSYAQKAQIDPYLRAANQAYGKTQTSNGRTLKSEDSMALRSSLRAVGIEADNQEELKVNVLLEFDGNTSDLENLGYARKERFILSNPYSS